MIERVTTITGKKNSNILLVAPHGPDDIFTAEITKHMADILKCHAVINNGFKRSKIVDSVNSQANCNSISHCQEEVVWEEFLKPIINFEKNYWTADDQLNFCIYYIHGMGTLLSNTDIILGFGLGVNKNSLTMQDWRAYYLYDSLNQNFDAKFGKGGGNYAARSKDNLTQLYRSFIKKKMVESIQIEIAMRYRNLQDAEIFAEFLADSIQNCTDAEDYNAANKKYLAI